MLAVPRLPPMPTDLAAASSAAVPEGSRVSAAFESQPSMLGARCLRQRSPVHAAAERRPHPRPRPRLPVSTPPPWCSEPRAGADSLRGEHDV